jgi:hypothetical protein
MPSWILKSALQNIIGWLPKGYWWNGVLQKHVTKGYYPSRKTFEAKLKCCGQHLDHYLKHRPTQRTGFTALELGTGSWPIVPLGLYLCGASEIWTYDLVPVLRSDTLRHTLRLFSELGRDGSLNRILPAIRNERFAHLEELMEDIGEEPPIKGLRRLSIHLRLGDARSTTLPAASIDLIFSTVVLEHISPDVLTGLFDEFKRVGSDGAIMSHFVGLADQYASFDTSITPYNFMRYSDRMWRFLNNSMIPQSRLRIADYRELLQETGWDIVEENNIFGSPDDLKKIRLAQRFRHYSTEDLLVLYSWLVARL